MGIGMIDNQKIEIRCPSCREKFREMLYKIKKSGSCCPKCKAELKGEEFRRELKKIERMLEDLMREEL